MRRNIGLLFLALLFFGAPLEAVERTANFRLNKSIVKSPVLSTYFTPEKYGTKQTDSLRERFGMNKEIPAEYELPILLALAHYPELREERICFKVTDSRFPAATRPKIGSLLTRNKRKRQYVMIISECGNEEMEAFLLDNLHLNAQVGLLGHELGHMVQYQDMSKAKVLGTALNYLSQKKRERLEKGADRIAIEHGLGWQLYDWASTIREGDKLLSSKRYINRIYLTPGKIKGYMWQLGYYEPDKPESHLPGGIEQHP